jgi:arylsulfatase A-like enzyme
LLTIASNSLVLGQAGTAVEKLKHSKAKNELPNIIIIYADDLGYGDVSCYGATAVKTPNIDRLAGDGIRFTSGYAPSASCTPSRYAMLTGEYAWRQQGKGIAPGDAPLLIEPGRTTMPSILKKAGYNTGVVGKWHLGLGDGHVNWNEKIAPGPREIGFDYSFIMPATGDRVPCVYVENDYVVNLDPEDPIEVSYQKPIGNAPTGRDHPEMLKMQTHQGHDGTIINGVSRIGYMRGGYSARWKDEEMADVLTERAINFIETNKDERFMLYFALHDPHVPRMPHERFRGKTEMGPRGDVIVQIDWCVGQVLDTLESLGISDNTMVIFSSDNGPVLNDGYEDKAVELLGDHKPSGPLRGWKYTRFEGGTRVPFILKWPSRVKGGRVSDAIVCHVDFPAAFAALTGQELDYKDAPDSLDILDALLGNSDQGRKSLILEGVYYVLGFRQGKWKYHPPSDERKIAGETGIYIGTDTKAQLYDIEKDPHETSNLAEKYPGIVKEMHERFQEIKKAGRSRGI